MQIKSCVERVPYVKPEAVEEVLRSEVKTGAAAKATDFIDNSLVTELERDRLFRKFYR
jgi:hypothetical protein